MNIRNIFCVSAVLCFFAGPVVSDDQLAVQFQNPPEQAKPWTWWHWCSGYITKEGITRDLEAMKTNGLGGAVIFNVAQMTPGPVKIFSPEWFDLLKHAAAEADRLKFKLSYHNCSGWQTAGGPWITPQLSMQQVSWSETVLSGPGPKEVILRKPFARMGYYKDTAVLAFPSPQGDEMETVGKGVKFSAEGKPLAKPLHLTDGDHDTEVQFKGDLLIEFPQPFEAQSLMLANARHQWGYADLYAENAPNVFKKIARVNLLYHSPFTGALNSVSFPPVVSSKFKLVFELKRGGPTVRLQELALSGYRINHWTAKAGFNNGADYFLQKSALATPKGVAIDPESIIDLTDKLSPDGRLTWDVPAGNWTVLRIGATTTGAKNDPSAEEGRGLEVDKMSPQAVDYHIDKTLGNLAEAIGPDLLSRTFNDYFIDSYESGFQNWSPSLMKEFATRRGYDMRPWLPAMTGRVVASVERTERFLWDLRRTIADLFAENFYGKVSERASKFGLQGSAEAYGGQFDFIESGGRMALPVAEFWAKSKVEAQKRHFAPVSSAHVYGKKIIGAEAYTGGDAWQMYPGSLKALGDFNMANGINRFYFHRYAHQPWVDERLLPGMTLGSVGMNFERTNTWWDLGRAWMQYLARCQFLLQVGVPVADFIYLTDESPQRGTKVKLKPPAGMDYDVAPSEVAMKRMQVRNGRIELPDGVSYRYLVLDFAGRMTPELLGKINELINAGATVIGSKPTYSPSNAGFPEADIKLQKLADELWGQSPAASGERTIGKGRLLWGKTLEEITRADNNPADFLPLEAGSVIHHLHRRSGDMDIYFLAWPGSEMRDFTCAFRVTGMIPEIWHPETGEMEKSSSWEVEGGVTRVSLRFPASGSLFVVFRQPTKSSGPGLQRVTVEGRTVYPSTASTADVAPAIEIAAAEGRQVLLARTPGEYQVQQGASRNVVSVSPPPSPIKLVGPWQVRFLSERGAPPQATFEKLVSWPDHSEAGIRFYSGTAEYEMEFSVDQLKLGWRQWLDLGRVEVIAQVNLNGQDLGTLWTHPYKVEVSKFLKPGKNKLQIRVANLWVNRMVGDEQYPVDFDVRGAGVGQMPPWLGDPSKRPEPRRFTFSTFRPFTKNTPLAPSGLIGPVKIESLWELNPEAN